MYHQIRIKKARCDIETGGKIFIGHNSTTNYFKIWGLGDIHYGSKACSLNLVKRDIGIIQDDPFSFVFLLGDLAEFIQFSDPRFDPSCVPRDLTVEDYGDLGVVLMKRVRDLLFPIKNRIIAAVQGNHEDQFTRRNLQQSLMSWLCVELGTKYLGYSGLIDVVFVRDAKFIEPRIVSKEEVDNNTSSRNSFRFLCHHGFGNALTEGGKLNTLIKLMERFQADCYLVGHTHDPSAKPIVQVGANDSCTKLIDIYKAGLISGSYLKTYEQGTVATYGEKKGMRPVPLGARFVKVYPFTRQLRVEI